MPLYQVLRCEECGHEWDDIDLTQSVTVGTIDWQDDGTFTLYSCPRCYLRLRVQREVDGSSWRHWRSRLPRAPGDHSDQLIARVSDRIAEVLSARRTIYQPVVIELGELACVQCEIPLVPGLVERPPRECPECRSARVIDTGGGGIVTLYCEPPPESKN
jgi:DNA-directed RNA polymerase subunit RPC12/RpoP